MKRYLLVAILLVVVAAVCFFALRDNSRVVHVRVEIDSTALRSGDLLFRNGMGNESLVVTSTSRGEYSHVGIAIATPGGWMAVHAVPGESAEGEPEYVKCEPIGVFFGRDRAQAGAVVRIDCNDSTAMAAALAAMEKVRDKVVFDNSYDMDDTTELYCTELVRLCYMRQGIDLSDDRSIPVPGVGTSGRIVFPEHLWRSPHITNKNVFKRINY